MITGCSKFPGQKAGQQDQYVSHGESDYINTCEDIYISIYYMLEKNEKLCPLLYLYCV